MKRLPCSDSSNNLIIAFFVYLNPSTAHCTACLQEPTVVQLPQSLHFVQRFSFHPPPNIHPQTHSLALLSSTSYSLSVSVQCSPVQSCPISSCPQRQLIHSKGQKHRQALRIFPWTGTGTVTLEDSSVPHCITTTAGDGGWVVLLRVSVSSLLGGRKNEGRKDIPSTWEGSREKQRDRAQKV